MRKCTIMKIPCGFKIRRKSDCDVFIKECMCNNNSYSVRNEFHDAQLIMEKDNSGNVTIYARYGDLNDIFNPQLAVYNCSRTSRPNDNFDNDIVQDYIWDWRKEINKEWFN